MTASHSSFWNSERIKEQQKRRELIKPFEGDCVKQGAYELVLGSEVFITNERTKRSLTPGEQVSIPPGQFALLLTREEVNIPDDVIAFISVRYTIKRKGLINVSGFHVDPGYCGRLKFAVYNAGSKNIVMSSGQRIFMIWFSSLNEPTPDPYQNKTAEQNEITSEDVMSLQGDVASPAALKKEIDELKRNFHGLLYVLAGILIGVVLLIIASFTGNKQTPPNISPPASPAVDSRNANQARQSRNDNSLPALENSVNPTPKPSIK
ncbi:MAG: dCTP deaminase domain-containing protein [Halobacteriota archaeon]